MATMHPMIRAELDNLERQFGNKAHLNMKEYAELYGIQYKYASIHVRRRGIPVSKEGHQLYVSMTDLATYKARHNTGPGIPVIQQFDVKKEAKRSRGFSQMAEHRQLG